MNRIINRLRSREKEARAKRVFTFPGAITTESEVARSATAYAKRMDSGVGDSQNKGYYKVWKGWYFCHPFNNCKSLGKSIVDRWEIGWFC